jgi:putative glutathione S-transferase
VLYVNYVCPWAHRTIIVRALKGLEDVIELIEVDGMTEGKGWTFTGQSGPEKDPLYGFTYLRQLYEKVEPDYEGKVTVPVLWDKKKGGGPLVHQETEAELICAETIVNNESSEIIRMLYDAFDEFIPEKSRELTKGKAGLFPEHARTEIEKMNDWVYNTVNNGVYKTGFASTQQAYEHNVFPLFKSLDRLEEHLSDSKHQPYLFGANITEADIRLFTTLIRFDVAYYPVFKCNLKMIRYDYPRLHQWLRTLYWDDSERTHGAFKNYTRFELVSIK